MQLALSRLRSCPLSLRRVDRTSLDFFQLRESISEVGLLQPLLVRPAADDWEVVDGNNRLQALRDLRATEAPCLVRDLSDAEILRIQVSANEVRCPTALLDLSRRLWRIVKDDKEMTLTALAHQLSRSPYWVRDVLNLQRLCPEAKLALERKEITLEEAIDLAKLPATIQVSQLGKGIENIRSAIRQHRSGNVRDQLEDKYGSDCKPAFRRYQEVVDEATAPSHAGPVLIACNATTPLEAWEAALRWMLQVDPLSLRKRKRPS